MHFFLVFLSSKEREENEEGADRFWLRREEKESCWVFDFLLLGHVFLRKQGGNTKLFFTCIPLKSRKGE